ncbi:MAG: sulfate reduction electron transfer complex DsrMKJOP subunit DsrO [Chloroflexota bacterium]
MVQSRREMLKLMLRGGTAAAAVAIGGGIASAQEDTPEQAAVDASKHWGMVIDLRKCIGCQACTVACAMENETPTGYNRTFVSIYEIEEDSVPRRAQLPRMCNHCADAPCLTVCPTLATYRTDDGIVVIDQDECIGCAYCVQACPYEARFVNPATQTVDKCNFCMHRVHAGLLPACVETCVGSARVFGDFNNPDSTVSKLIAEHDVEVLKPNENTRPNVYYIGLNEYLRAKVEGRPVPEIADALRPEVSHDA